jgi:tetratricopeptide (TPR) repeat protein
VLASVAMRLALLFEPHPDSDDTMPERPVVPLLPGVSVTRQVPAALRLGDENDAATLVLHVDGSQVLRGEAASSLDQAFATTRAEMAKTLDALIAEARDKQSGGELEAAAESYRKAEHLLGDDDGARRVTVCLGLAEIARHGSDLTAAASFLDRALALEPAHADALRARAEIARDQGHATWAAALLERLAPSLETSAKRVEVLLVVADDALKGARSAIGLAREFMPDSVHLLERAKAIEEAAGAWEAAVAAAVQIAELTEDPRLKARALVDAARLCSERMRHSQRAVALYEAAIQDDPEVAGAFEAIESELTAAGDYAGLAAAYERQIMRLEAAGSAPHRLELMRKLGRLHRDNLGDPRTAIRILDELIQLAPDDLPARLELAALLETAGEPALATRVLEVAAVLEPTRVEVYRSLRRLFARAEDQDRVYSACSVLVALGEADAEEQLVFAQYRPEAPPSPRSTLDDDAWSELLPPNHPTVLDELAAAFEPAALEAFARATHPSMPPPGERVHPHSIIAGRCFAFAAHLFGLPEPEIFLQPAETRVAARILPRRTLSIVLGRPVLAERSVGELAFLAAHHLAYARPGWRMIGLLETLEEIRSLMLGGMAVARPDLEPFATTGKDEQSIAQLLASHMDQRARETVALAVEKIVESGGTLDVPAWLKSVEETACRAGLLACGDVTVASSVLAVAGHPPGGLSAAERARSLLPFCVSQRYSALRHWMGVAI